MQAVIANCLAIKTRCVYTFYMITSKQAADQIGCSLATVSRWASRLGFSRKFGNSLVFTKTQVIAIEKAWKKHSGNPNFGKISDCAIANKIANR